VREKKEKEGEKERDMKKGRIVANYANNNNNLIKYSNKLLNSTTLVNLSIMITFYLYIE
jgi:hypothetical protein